jgi:hypothetical protein
MQKYIYKAFSIQLAIAMLYLSLTCYEFVVLRDPNPTGIGIQQWLLILSQFVFTSLLFLFMIHRATNKTLAKKKSLINLLSILLIVALYLCLSNVIWKELWNLRK